MRDGRAWRRSPDAERQGTHLECSLGGMARMWFGVCEQYSAYVIWWQKKKVVVRWYDNG